ncbi:MAG: HisA/HisF-related TIM barrel protein [Acidimicrobiia bacterium]
MDLYARINILDGLSVRLPKGGLDEAIALDNDPIGRAHNWVKQGVDYLHVVDLDAAAYRDYRNRDLIGRLVEEAEVPVMVAGGIRSEGEAERIFNMGAWRMVMGTAAIENQIMVWDLCREYPERIVVSLDVRANEEIATQGWTQSSGRFLEEVLIEMSSAGVVSFLVSEAGRDALEDPPNLQILAEALAAVEDTVIASGGVRDLDDLRKLVQLEAAGRRLGGVVVGREVTAGRFTIDEAKEVLAGRGPTRAPGGINSTRSSVGVSSLSTAVEFYTETLGFEQLRTPAHGVDAAVVQSAPGQQIELVEGGASRPDSLLFKVDDIQRWKDHFAHVGVSATATAAGLELNDPDGLTIRLESS